MTEKSIAEFESRGHGYERATDGENECPIHTLVAIANGADPYKVFSNSYDVHHINQIEWDNRPENLEVLSRSKHRSMHRMERKLKERELEKSVTGEQIDRSPGNGSGKYADQAFDHETPEDVYRASDASTTFNSREGGDIMRSDGTRLSYSELFKMHHDVHQITNDGEEFTIRKRKKDIANICDIIASQLELTEVQKQRLYKYVESAPFDKGGSLAAEALVLAATTLAVNKDDRWLRREDEYIQLQSAFGISNQEIKTARQFFRDYSDI